MDNGRIEETDWTVATASASRSGLKLTFNSSSVENALCRDGLCIPVGTETKTSPLYPYAFLSRDGLCIPVGTET